MHRTQWCQILYSSIMFILGELNTTGVFLTPHLLIIIIIIMDTYIAPVSAKFDAHA